jgi:hypothetical protein
VGIDERKQRREKSYFFLLEEGLWSTRISPILDLLPLCKWDKCRGAVALAEINRIIIVVYSKSQ